MAGILQLTTGQVYLVGGAGTLALSTVTFADGTVAAPSQAFTSETGSGLYRIGTSNVGAAISGVLVFDWNASRVNFAQPLYAPNGTVGAPSYVFTNDTTSGRYRLGVSNVGEAIAGAAVYDWNATRLNTAVPIYTANGTVGAPSYVFANDTTSGRYRIGSNNLGEAINGVLVFDWNATRVNLAEHLFFTADNTYDIGAVGATRPRTGYFGTSINVGTNPAGQGVIRIPNSGIIYGRLQNNSGDRQLLYLNGNNLIVLGESGVHILPGSNNLQDLGDSGDQIRTGYFGTSIITPIVNATTRIQYNGTALQVSQSSPSDPTGTTNTTGLMMGLAGTITPASTRIMIVISGNLANNTINDGAKMQIRYGTGTAPANAAALTGTAVGNFATITGDLAANNLVAATCNAIVTGLTAGTAYWIDVALAAITGGTASVAGVSISALDIP